MHTFTTTKLNLHIKKVVKNNLCLVCALEPKTTSHILWSCPFAKDVWVLDRRIIQKSTLSVDDLGVIFNKLISSIDPSSILDTIAIIA